MGYRTYLINDHIIICKIMKIFPSASTLISLLSFSLFYFIFFLVIYPLILLSYQSSSLSLQDLIQSHAYSPPPYICNTV